MQSNNKSCARVNFLSIFSLNNLSWYWRLAPTVGHLLLFTRKSKIFSQIKNTKGYSLVTQTWLTRSTLKFRKSQRKTRKNVKDRQRPIPYVKIGLGKRNIIINWANPICARLCKMTILCDKSNLYKWCKVTILCGKSNLCKIVQNDSSLQQINMLQQRKMANYESYSNICIAFSGSDISLLKIIILWTKLWICV